MTADSKGKRSGTGPGRASRPSLPETAGKVEIEVRDRPGGPSRALPVHLVYPRGGLAGVGPGTGLMLSLHNWGGTIWDNTPDPNVLAGQYDVVAIGVTYYQSGDKGNEEETEPYDFGYVQAMDAIRALHYVYCSLRDAGRAFDRGRIYCTGGSGGGNVTLMANKFAPNTFACIVDFSGMAALTDGIAYRLPGGGRMSARYSRDPASPAYLSRDMQEIRDPGHPTHLALQAKSANRCKIVVIHGEDDVPCPVADKRRMTDAMRAAGMDVEPHFISAADVDGQTIVNSAHQIGNRTALLMRFAGPYLSPESAAMRRLASPCDFDRRQAIAYPTSGGVHVISYAGETPALRFDAASPR